MLYELCHEYSNTLTHALHLTNSNPSESANDPNTIDPTKGCDLLNTQMRFLAYVNIERNA